MCHRCLLCRWSLYKFGEPLLLGSRLRKRALAECMKHIHYEVSLGFSTQEDSLSSCTECLHAVTHSTCPEAGQPRLLLGAVAQLSGALGAAERCRVMVPACRMRTPAMWTLALSTRCATAACLAAWVPPVSLHY